MHLEPDLLYYYDVLGGSVIRIGTPMRITLEECSGILGVAVEVLLGIGGTRRRKTGPAGHLAKRLSAIQTLSRRERRFVLKFLDQVLETHEEKRRRRRGIYTT